MQFKSKSVALLVSLMLMTALALAACGADPTATPAPTTAAATTVAATVAPTTAPTTVAPTKAATTAPATTVAATTAATAVATTAATSATTAATANLSLPAITGASELQLDASIVKEIGKVVPGLTNPTVKLYVSEDDAEKLANNADTILNGAGYKFGLPGSTKPAKQGDQVVGFYVKSGSPDILLASGAIPANPDDLGRSLNIPGLDAAAIQKLTDQVKGKKSLMVLLAAPGLLQTLLGATGTTTTTTAVATTAATGASTAVAGSTTAAATTGGEVGETDIPIYAGAKRVDKVSGSLGGLTSLYYVSSDDYAKITGWAKQAFIDKGWADVQTLEAGGATVITGKKGNSNLLGTIVGPKARGDASFDSVIKQAEAGPNDTVIAVVVTGQ